MTTRACRPLVAMALWAIFVGGCSANKEPTQIGSRDGQAQVTVPGNWKAETDLNDQADLQVADRYRELYLIVLTENKGDFGGMTLDLHSQGTRSQITSGLQDAQVSGEKRVTINGHPGVQYEIRGVIDNLKVVYIHTTVETAKNFHQILAWTLDSHYDKNKSELDEAINSFREVGA